MKKYILSFCPQIDSWQINTALVKPKTDVIMGAKELGFEEIMPLGELHYNKDKMRHDVRRYDFLGRFFRKYNLYQHVNNNIQYLKKFFEKIAKEDILLIQYPMYGNEAGQLFPFLIDSIGKLQCKKVILIHDVEAYQVGRSFVLSWEEEREFIRSFDHIIVHNDTMKAIFSDGLDSARIHSLEVFDYRLDQVERDWDSILYKRDRSSVFFAGNLSKSSFLKDIDKISNFNFYVYGPNFDEDYKNENVHYGGIVSNSEVIGVGEKYAYGLVWDGDSIDDLSGHYGDYMKLNTPYKLSSNIAASLPIITSKKAGIARYIEEKQIGLTVNSLTELNDLKITSDEYEILCSNIIQLRESVVKGDVFKRILKKVLGKLTVLHYDS